MTKKKTDSTSNPYRLRIATAITAVLVGLSILDAIVDPPLDQQLIGALTALAVAWGGFGADYLRHLNQ